MGEDREEAEFDREVVGCGGCYESRVRCGGVEGVDVGEDKGGGLSSCVEYYGDDYRCEEDCGGCSWISEGKFLSLSLSVVVNSNMK